MKKLAALFIPFSVFANDLTIDVGQTNALSSNTALQSRSGSYLSVINVSTLYDENNRVAKGTQTVDFYLHDNAPMSLKVAGNLITPGETKKLSLTANAAGGLDIPINSNALGVVGDAFFTMTINKVKALSCPSDYTLYTDGTCRKWVYKDITGYECRNAYYPYNYSEGEGGLDPTKCYGRAAYIPDPEYACPDGYIDRGWGTEYAHYCTDVDAYVADDKPLCESQGGKYAWDGKNNVCSFRVPISIDIPNICSDYTVYTGPNGQYRNCVDLSMVRDASPTCPRNFSYDSYHKNCRAQSIKEPS